MGRRIDEIDARSGATTHTFDALDRVLTAITPEPGTGQPRQTTR